MNVLLIDPPFYRFFNYYNRYFPLGLGYLSSALKKAGHRTVIYDADCNKNPKGMDYTRLPEKYYIYIRELRNPENPIIKEISKTITKHQPDIVGITVMTPKVASAYTVARLVKKYNKNCYVVFGGPHAALKADEIMKNTEDVDFVINGEGELALPELLNILNTPDKTVCNTNSNSSAQPGAGSIQGISHRSGNTIVHNTVKKFVEDLDCLLFPDREALSGSAVYTSEDMGLLMGSRGCPYHCSYCATQIWTRKVRYRSLTNIMEEIVQVYNTYGTRQFTFKDDSFTIQRKRVLEFCDMLLSKGIKINWDCNTRIDLVDSELLRTMKRAGCNSIKVGIESGSKRILALMDKGITLEKIKESARLFRKEGIHWTAYFMMGVPTETKEDIKKTLELLYAVKPCFASIGVYEPFPGTRLFDIGVETGLLRKEMSYNDFFTRLPSDYYLKDINRRVDTMNKEDFISLEKEVKDAFHNYNKSLIRIYQRGKARSRVYFNTPGIFFNDIEKFLGWIK
ncbi:MAG: B12-binding domain-containing radical SAM protein [Candidatus Loosdrechtia sp.]|uniref:B12-binding domain-containing radical SAM protein n=1 Tax=Candidatus Loosdrechtia sp. TaxID=3101272 RepID=UPI003A68EDDD|nr:MAG: radical SAM protein [Candidatus Jettenia sp. AMX2]